MISTKTLASLLILTMAISLFGTLISVNRLHGLEDWFSLTGAWGFGSNTRAATNISITSNLFINFTDDTANFDDGYVRDGFAGCTIATDGTNTSGCVNFLVPNGLLLENQGNRYARINISNGNYSNSLLGGVKSGYAVKWETPESSADKTVTCYNSSENGLNINWSAYYNNYVNLTQVFDANTAFCDKFNYTDGNDVINMSIKFHIDITALARGFVDDTWLVQAVDAGQ